MRQDYCSAVLVLIGASGAKTLALPSGLAIKLISSLTQTAEGKFYYIAQIIIYN